jgi:broad specificity phosphatase PhoE
MTRLIVWRHGNTDWNATDRVQGQTDTPLNDVGREQAAAAAPLLAALRPDAIVASDLQRARHTADTLAALTGLQVRIDPRLRERYYGLWQGLSLADVAERFPAEYARWRAGNESPGAEVESLDDLGKRVGEALQEAADARPGGTIVVATHGGAARQGCGYLLGWSTAVLRTIGPLQNCHWTELRHDGVRRDPAARSGPGEHGFRGWQLRAHNVGVPTGRPIPEPI